jgi:hypothetical protein
MVLNSFQIHVAKKFADGENLAIRISRSIIFVVAPVLTWWMSTRNEAAFKKENGRFRQSIGF